MQQNDFDKFFNRAHEDKSPNFDEHINVAVVGKVSAGKSSLLNAILERGRSDPLAKVGAHSGVTTKITAYKLDKHVLIIDCPGLDDVRAENSEETKEFLDSIDLGLFVITGSADASQKSNYDDLKRNCKKVMVILNKIDEWDDLEESAYESVVSQWKEVLGANKVYGTCTKGYDPKMRQSAPMDIRGVDEVKGDIFDFLEKVGKSILFARHLKNKEKYAIGIIATALAAVAGEAFIPGSAAYITATQVVAITSLHYLYTGQILNKSSALSLLPQFAGQSIGMTAFLWAKSFLPPTLVLDLAAMGIAVVITFAMLATVKWILENGHPLEQGDMLKDTFNDFKKVGSELKDMSIDDLKNKHNIYELIKRLLAKQ
ncbi:small GTP-binding protein [Nitrosomonas oligotropha]|uniref:Small GTP-binding protein n=1 Tax=Nitrosomonas oligotropha TaxID=42354 RepID=A0A2T5I234_9PROT|nr:GTPase [Nitrosomonas oligotropha]PTQ77876.1 small GTP-binding protein [Nitrosomonas oligotropha]